MNNVPVNDNVNVSIFVGNLSIQCVEINLHDAFYLYGSIVNVRIMRSRKNISLGYGFVAMGSSEETEAAIAGLNGTVLLGRSMRLSISLGSGNGNCNGNGKNKNKKKKMDRSLDSVSSYSSVSCYNLMDYTDYTVGSKKEINTSNKATDLLNTIKFRFVDNGQMGISPVEVAATPVHLYQRVSEMMVYELYSQFDCKADVGQGCMRLHLQLEKPSEIGSMMGPLNHSKSDMIKNVYLRSVSFSRDIQKMSGFGYIYYKHLDDCLHALQCHKHIFLNNISFNLEASNYLIEQLNSLQGTPNAKVSSLTQNRVSTQRVYPPNTSHSNLVHIFNSVPLMYNPSDVCRCTKYSSPNLNDAVPNGAPVWVGGMHLANHDAGMGTDAYPYPFLIDAYERRSLHSLVRGQSQASSSGVSVNGNGHFFAEPRLALAASVSDGCVGDGHIRSRSIHRDDNSSDCGKLMQQPQAFKFVQGHGEINYGCNLQRHSAVPGGDSVGGGNRESNVHSISGRVEYGAHNHNSTHFNMNMNPNVNVNIMPIDTATAASVYGSNQIMMANSGSGTRFPSDTGHRYDIGNNLINSINSQVYSEPNPGFSTNPKTLGVGPSAGGTTATPGFGTGNGQLDTLDTFHARSVAVVTRSIHSISSSRETGTREI